MIDDNNSLEKDEHVNLPKQMIFDGNSNMWQMISAGLIYGISKNFVTFNVCVCVCVCGDSVTNFSQKTQKKTRERDHLSCKKKMKQKSVLFVLLNTKHRVFVFSFMFFSFTVGACIIVMCRDNSRCFTTYARVFRCM